jgi:hypothetical protein
MIYIGHKGFYATRATILYCFWWPGIHSDIHWFVQTCLICQQQLHHVLIPPVITMPVLLFPKVFMDTMQLLPSSGFRFIVQGCCSLSIYPKWCKLCSETARPYMIRSSKISYANGPHSPDNGKAFIKTLKYISHPSHLIQWLQLSCEWTC